MGGFGAESQKAVPYPLYRSDQGDWPLKKRLKMRIFVVNCGSSSIKYQLFDMAGESVLAKGILERVGTDEAKLRHNTHINDRNVKKRVSARNHSFGMKVVIDALVDPEIGVLDSVDQIDGVGHRVVHGGEQVTHSSMIDERILSIIHQNKALAPLHAPTNLSGIMAAVFSIPNAEQVAVFDTAFLATLPPRAYRYAVPASWYREHHVRRYGFHGISHRYVTFRAAEILGKSVDQVNLITAHLGNGCSMTAVAGGKAIDHSMGMTPLEGLVMGTRSGDIDPAIIFYLRSRGMAAAQIDMALNRESGLLGLSELSNDMRDLLVARDAGHEGAKLATEIFVYRLAKYIGSYHAILPDLDAIVLTGGIGENAAPIRWDLCQQLAPLGILGDFALNETTINGQTGPITTDKSSLPVLIIPTNEELMIARDTQRIISGK